MNDPGTPARGYYYQDVATAYLMIRAICEGAVSMTVDRKEYAGDIFDDLVISYPDKTVKRQFKSSAMDKAFSALTNVTGDLRIDDIVYCYVTGSPNTADEYRICTTWSEATDEDLVSVMQPCTNTDASFDGWTTTLYKLNIDKLWPQGGKLVWKLAKRKKQLPDMKRADLESLCERLVIELNCPQISLDPNHAGDLELLLFEVLRSRVGIGIHPNEDRTPEDVAAVLFKCATMARSAQSKIHPIDILSQCGLETDRGRIDQPSPVIPSEHVERRSSVRALAEAILNGKQGIEFVGPPGSGKSWMLSDVCDFLRNQGHIVARHYCHVDTIDPLRRERVLIATLYSNLVSELISNVPELNSETPTLLGADRRELAKTLEKTSSKLKPGQKVILCVDGLDHVARVLAEDKSLSPNSVAVVAELSQLSLPDNCVLVIGSQPIKDLQLFQEAHSVDVPPLSRRDILELGLKLDLWQQVCNSQGPKTCRNLARLIETRCEGNPLYARYLMEHALQATSEGLDVKEIIKKAPPFDGDINNYYSYLGTDLALNPVSRILANIEFSLTAEEIKEILPAFKPDIERWMKDCSPLMHHLLGQGGYRLYHDSYKRFVVAQCLDQHIEISDILQPVIDWLQKRGFLQDDRSFNFLFSLLAKCGLYDAIVQAVDKSFIKQSLEYGHSERSIRSNLVAAAAAACVIKNYNAMCRIIELHRSVQRCFWEHLSDFRSYGAAFAAVRGYDMLSSRLQIEGRPSYPVSAGLQLCSLSATSGAAPPWSTYLIGDDDLDANATVAAIHGLFLRRAPASIRDACHLLQQLHQAPFRHALALIAGQTGYQSIFKVIAILKNFNKWQEFELLMCLCEGPYGKKHPDKAQQLADKAYAAAESLEDRLRAVTAGATINPQDVPDVAELVDDLLRAAHVFENHKVYEWCLLTRLLASTQPKFLREQTDRIPSDSWYHSWLRFVARISLAHNDTDPAKATLAAFSELLAHTDPFIGQPRPCDLSSIHSSIVASMKVAGRLLLRDDDLLIFFDGLQTMADTLTVSLHGEPTAPILDADVIAIMASRFRRVSPPAAIINQLEKFLERTRSRHLAYSTQVEAGIRMTKLLASCKQDENALTEWERTCTYLAAYGSHKDTTILDLVKSLPFLKLPQTRQALKMVLPLIAEVDAHGGGGDCDYAITEWFAVLAAIDLSAAAQYLAKSIELTEGKLSWRHRECLAIVCTHLSAEIVPGSLLLFWVNQDLPHRTDLMKILVEAAIKVAPNDSLLARSIFNRLTEMLKLAGYGGEEIVLEKLKELSLLLNTQLLPDLEQRASRDRSRRKEASEFVFSQEEPCWKWMNVLESAKQNRETLSFTALLDHLFSDNAKIIRTNPDCAIRILRFIRDEFTDSDWCAEIAERSRDAGLLDLSAEFHVVKNRRNPNPTLRGLSKRSANAPLKQSLAFAREQTERYLLEDVAEFIESENFIEDLSSYWVRAVETTYGTEAGFDAWNQAFDVVSLRLPEPRSGRIEFAELEQDYPPLTPAEIWDLLVIATYPDIGNEDLLYCMAARESVSKVLSSYLEFACDGSRRRVLSSLNNMPKCPPQLIKLLEANGHQNQNRRKDSQ